MDASVVTTKQRKRTIADILNPTETLAENQETVPTETNANDNYFKLGERQKFRVNKIITEKLVNVETDTNKDYGISLHSAIFIKTGSFHAVDKRSKRTFKLQIIEKEEESIERKVLNAIDVRTIFEIYLLSVPLFL